MRRTILIAFAVALSVISWIALSDHDSGPDPLAPSADSEVRTSPPTAESMQAAREDTSKLVDASRSAPTRHEVPSVAIRTTLAGGDGMPRTPIAVVDATGATLWRGSTGDAGVVEVPLAMFDGYDLTGARAVLAFPCAQPVIEPISTDAEKPTTLVVPDLCSVSIRFTHTGGERRPWRVHLRALAPGERLGEHPVGTDAATQIRVATSRARFSWCVGKGARLMVWLEDPNTEFAAAPATRPVYFAGVGANGNAHVELFVDADGNIVNPRITGRVVDLSRAAIADRILASHWDGVVAQRSARNSRRVVCVPFTDAEGRFEWFATRKALMPVSDPGRGRLELRGREGRCSRPIPPTEEEAGFDLGVFVLGELPAICTGVVRDARGGPVEGARVLVEERRGSIDALAFWSPVTREAVRTDADGRFAVYGHATDTAKLRLRVRMTGFGETDPIPIVKNQRGVLVHLVAEAHVIACVAESELGLPFVEFVLYRLDAGGQRGRPHSRHADQDGYFVWRNLRPGTYDFEVKQYATTLFEAEDIQIVEGRNAPEVMQDVEVRSGPQWTHIRLLSPTGQPLTMLFDVTAHHVATAREIELFPDSIDASCYSFRLPEDSKKVRFQAARHEPVVVDCVGPDIEVVLPRTP